MFRSLRHDEIEVRVQSVAKSGKGFTLLLYKDARCDMAILDETVGPMSWERTHSRENKNCTVSVYDDAKKMWISKEDTGSESNTEAQKGLASDSFKRACFNWGIGRELYSSPFVFISDTSYIKQANNKSVVYEKFSVYHIKTEVGVILELGIKDSRGKQVYNWRKQ